MIKTHRPLLSITLALSLGILVSQIARPDFRLLVLLTFFSLFLNGLWIKKKIIAGSLTVVSFVFLGMVCCQNSQVVSEDHIIHAARYHKKGMTFLEGIVVSDVQRRPFFKGKKNIFILDVKRIKAPWGWIKKSGRVLVQIFRETPVQYGDYLRLKGKLYRPFNFSEDEKFSYREYLERKGIKLMFSVGKKGEYQVLRFDKGNGFEAAAYRLKNRLAKIFWKHLTANEAAIMIGVVLGDRYLIPKHINELFIQTGTVHILAISGFNVGIVAFIIFVILKTFPLGRRWQYMLTIFFLVFYAFLTGGQPSVVRATIMACIFLASFLLEKESEPTNSLALAALIILLQNPMNLFDVGFQLSFISVLAILHFHPMIMRVLGKLPFDQESRVAQSVLQCFSVSLAVWIWLAALLVYYFQIITPVTILANFVVIPFSTVLIILGFGMVFLAMLWPPLALAFAACIKVTLNAMIACIYLLSQLPWAYVYTKEISLRQVFVYYGIMGLGVLLFVLIRKLNPPKSI